MHQFSFIYAFAFSFSIIKRRIAWVIGKWISSRCSPANNSKIWDVLVHLLMDRGTRTDAVVRLTAAISLKECVDVSATEALGHTYTDAKVFLY